MKNIFTYTCFAIYILCILGCESVYYDAWEKLGVHKRDLLTDRIEDTQEAQLKTQEQFSDALKQFKAVVNFDGGDLEKLYTKLNAEYEASEKAANLIRDRIDSMEDVAEDLFQEWQEELALYTDQRLKRDSAAKLKDTQARYKKLLTSMNKAEKTVHPVLNSLRDNVLYLKHNLNAQAIGTLKGELSSVDSEVTTLIREMQKSIDESNRFIASLKS